MERQNTPLTPLTTLLNDSYRPLPIQHKLFVAVHNFVH